MIKSIYILNNESIVETKTENIPKIIEQKPKLLWIDIKIENNEFDNEELSLLTETFKFHELSIEDCLIPQYHSKIEEFENYVFIAIHGIKSKIADLSEFENSIYEIDMFILKDCVVTVHTDDILILESIFEKAKIKPQVELKNIENLLYNIFSKVLDNYEFYIDKMNDKIDQIEDKVLENPSNEIMSEIFLLKKIFLTMRKIIEPQKNVYSYFTR